MKTVSREEFVVKAYDNLGHPVELANLPSFYMAEALAKAIYEDKDPRYCSVEVICVAFFDDDTTEDVLVELVIPF